MHNEKKTRLVQRTLVCAEGGREYRCNREPANRWNRNGEPAEPVRWLDGLAVGRRSDSRLFGRLDGQLVRYPGVGGTIRSAGCRSVRPVGWFGRPVRRSGQPVRSAG